MPALHVHLDALGGVAGDMFVAAVLHLRPDLCDRVMTDLAAVLPEGAQPRLRATRAGGLSARGLALDEVPPASHAIAAFPAFRDRIASAPLSAGTAAQAVGILTRLAEAEAAVHGVDPDRVHFHELADWDALMDVTAAGSLAAALDASWSVSPLPLGSGTVRTAHGLLPVPAPATAAILTGYEWHDDGISGERVTPTGAAIAAHLTGGRGNGARPAGRLVGTGYGAGTRTLPGVPNLLRASLFETATAGDERLTLLACDVDDMTGEEIATAADRLRQVPGVRDVVLLAAQGKKGRPVTRFELQVAPNHADAVARAVFAETSTLGLRMSEVRRQVLAREADSAAGLRVKRAVRPGGRTVKAEADDLAATQGLAARRAAARAAET